MSKWKDFKWNTSFLVSGVFPSAGCRLTKITNLQHLNTLNSRTGTPWKNLYSCRKASVSFRPLTPPSTNGGSIQSVIGSAPPRLSTAALVTRSTLFHWFASKVLSVSLYTVFLLFTKSLHCSLSPHNVSHIKLNVVSWSFGQKNFTVYTVLPVDWRIT